MSETASHYPTIRRNTAAWYNDFLSTIQLYGLQLTDLGYTRAHSKARLLIVSSQ